MRNAEKLYYSNKIRNCMSTNFCIWIHINNILNKNNNLNTEIYLKPLDESDVNINGNTSIPNRLNNYFVTVGPCRYSIKNSISS